MTRSVYLLCTLLLVLSACDTGESPADLADADREMIEAVARSSSETVPLTAPLPSASAVQTGLSVDLGTHDAANFYFDSELKPGYQVDPLYREEQWRVDIHSQSVTASGALETMTVTRYQPGSVTGRYDIQMAWPGIDADAVQVCWWSGDPSSLTQLGCERVLVHRTADGQRANGEFVDLGTADEEGKSYHKLPSGRIVIDYEEEINGGARLMSPQGQLFQGVTFVSIRFLDTDVIGDPAAPAQRIVFDWHPTVDLWLTRQDLY
ncbi:MAG: hypothetical protein AAGI52_08430 [Bacteroidota bacterium]